MEYIESNLVTFRTFLIRDLITLLLRNVRKAQRWSKSFGTSLATHSLTFVYY